MRMREVPVPEREDELGRVDEARDRGRLTHLERLHRSTVTVTITIKSGSHKGMNQYFMVTVEKVSPTGASITITFMVMVTAAINLGSLWRDFT
jgi:hypothetical protein